MEGLARVRANTLRARSTASWATMTRSAWSRRMEEIGIRMLLNESEAIERGGERIHLVGIDDAHYYRVDNIEKARRAGSRRGILDPAVSHPGDLSAGGACRVQAAAERAHPWRSDLPARRHSDHPRFGPAETHGGRSRGPITTWSDTPRSGSAHASSRCGSTARRKLRCIVCGAIGLNINTAGRAGAERRGGGRAPPRR